MGVSGTERLVGVRCAPEVRLDRLPQSLAEIAPLLIDRDLPDDSGSTEWKVQTGLACLDQPREEAADAYGQANRRVEEEISGEVGGLLE